VDDAVTRRLPSGAGATLPAPARIRRACARSAVIHADLRAVERFFDDEASTLARAITATGYVGYPVSQRDRDALFLRYRDVHSAITGGAASARLAPGGTPHE
jgi:hypothetical protein